MITHIKLLHIVDKKILFLIPIALAFLQTTGARPTSLSVQDAVQKALASDSRVESALMDMAASHARVEEARRNRYPSLSLSGGYTRLSSVTSTIPLGPTSVELGSQDDAFTMSANFQYPVFAGFRLREAVKTANLQALGKEVSVAVTRNAVAFETRRGYWEAVRTSYNVNMLKENLMLMKKNKDVTKLKLTQGTVMQADLLSADMRYDQAEMNLGDAVSAQKRAFFNLESLVYPADRMKTSLLSRDKDSGELPFELVSSPEDLILSEYSKSFLTGDIDESVLMREALHRRPETRVASLASDMARSSMDMAKAPLYPTLSVTGNYTYANPNQRVAFQSEASFTGTWSLGIAFSYEIGSIPAELSELDARKAELHSSIAGQEMQEELVLQDVRGCLVFYTQIKKDIELVSGMLNQATENERVTSERVKTGMASDLDQLRASIGRLRSEFSIVNKQIDLQIAAADLCRAAALTEFN